MSTDDEHPAARAARDGKTVHGMAPFALFCAYHLGLMPDGTVRFANVHDVARAFGVGIDEVGEALRAFALDPETMVHGGFDVASAQADVQVSPEGVDLGLLAAMHWDALVASWGTRRDWEGELREDARENARGFEDEAGREQAKRGK